MFGEHLEPIPVERNRSRVNDHHTSESAGESVQKGLNELQTRVMLAISECGPMTDGELERTIKAPVNAKKPYAYSTVRKRRTELCQAGYLDETGDVRTGMKVWTFTAEGRDYVRRKEASDD
jgi:hypothetical protein